MSLLTTIYISVMAICLSLSLMNLVIWLNQPKKIYYLLFAISSFSSGALAYLEGTTLQLTSVAAYQSLLSVYVVFLATMIISLVWFIYFYLKEGKKIFLYAITMLWLLALIFNFSGEGNLVYSQVNELKQYSFFGKDTFYMPSGDLKSIRFIADLASLFVIAFLISATVNHYRKSNKEKALVIGGGALLFILIAGIITPLTDIKKVSLPSMVSIPFMFIMLSMSYELIKDILKVPSLKGKLKANTRNWQNLLDEVELIVVEVDLKGEVKYVNPYYKELTGFDINEVIGKDWLNELVPQEEHNKLKKSFENTSEFNFPKHSKSKILTKSKKALEILWSNIGLCDDNGNLISLLGVGNDITERENACNQLFELKQQLELENIVLKERLSPNFRFDDIIGKSDTLIYALFQVEKVAPTDTTVLLEGETGVGKELFAKAIHSVSKRKDKPLIRVNCASIPHTLIESELFGHEKGAFTGADKKRIGRFELADAGTLFLDEIGELPMALQPKLLRVLEEGEFERLGSSKTQKVNVRVIAATNRNLRDEISNGRFREDLFYRLSAFQLSIPPLRDRIDDIPLLVDTMVKDFNKRLGKNISKINKHTISVLSKYSWPGNVRELRNIIERSMINSTGPELKIDKRLLTNSNKDQDTTTLLSLEEVERRHIENILKVKNWRVEGEKGAAVVLGLNPNTLRNRMKKLNIQRPQ